MAAQIPYSFYQDPVLAGVASGFRDGGFVADQVFPVVVVGTQTGQVFNIDPDNDFLRDQDTVRAPGAPANVIPFNAPTKTQYNAIDHALTGVIPDELRKQAISETQAALPEVQRVTAKILRRREIELVTTLGTLSQTSSPTTKWNAALGDAIKDIVEKKQTIRDSVGADPTSLVIPAQVLDAISQTASYKSQIRYTNSPLTLGIDETAAVLAKACGLREVIVARSYKNNARFGQTASNATIWGENVLLFVKDPVPSASMPQQTLGMHIVWSGGEAGQGGFMVEREYDPRRKSEMIYVHHYYDQFLLNAGAGYLWTNTLD